MNSLGFPGAGAYRQLRRRVSAGAAFLATHRTWVNTAVYLGTTMLTSVLGLGTALLMTHLLAPDQYGRLGVFLSVLYIVVPMVSFAAEGLIAVNRSSLDDADYERFRRTVVAVGLRMFALLQTVGVALWAAGVVHDALVLLVPVLALLRLATTMATSEYIVEQKVLTYAGLTVLNSVVALALTFALLAGWSPSAGARVAALILAEFVLIFGRYRGRMHLLLRPAYDGKYGRQIVAYGWPSMIALFGGWGLNEFDKVAVAHGAGLTAAGVYTAAAALVTVMVSFNQALTNALFPRLFRSLAETGASVPRLMAEYVGKFVLLNGVFAVVIMAGYFLVKDALLPPKYAAASTYFYALVVANLTIAVFRPLGLVAEYFKLARLRAVAIVCGGAVSIATSSAGVYLSGNPLWAAAGLGCGYLVAAAILAVKLLHLSPDELAKKNR